MLLSALSFHHLENKSLTKLSRLYTIVCMNNLVISNKEAVTIKAIRNALVNFGKCPSLRDLMGTLGYRSPRSVALLINKLISKGVLRRNSSGALQLVMDVNNSDNVQTINVPLVGTVACGIPILAEENIESWFPVSTKLAQPPHKYFLVRAKGDSMNQKGIKDGAFLLVRKQETANTGDIIIALVDNEVTAKEYILSGDTVILKPCSNNKQHKPIVVTRDFQVQGVVVTTIQDLEG